MRILFENIPKEGLQWKGTLELDNNRLEKAFAYAESTELVFEIHPFKNMFRLKGRMRGSAVLQCSRCLENYQNEYDIRFENILAREPLSGETEEVELQNDDMCYSFNHGEGINMIDIVSEQILLDIPMKTLCSVDCKGLCTECGSNLNIEQCECHLKKEKVDPRLSALAEIKKDMGK